MLLNKFLKNNLIKPKSNETNNFNVVPNIHNTDDFDTKNIHTLYINYPTHSSEEIKQMLGRKWLSILKRVYVFYETYKHVIPTNPNVSIPLSTISPVLQEFLGYQVNVSNFIKFMKKIDLLIIDKTRYSSLFHICKTYFFNKKLMLVLKEMFKELDFNENTIKEVYKKTKKQRKKRMKRSLKKKIELKETNLGNCRINAKNCKRSDIEASFWQSNPNAVEAYNTFEEINEKYYDKNTYLKNHLDLHIKKTDKNYVALSMRGYSPVCGSLNDIDKTLTAEKERVLYKKARRSEYAKRYFKDEPFKRIDIHASAFQITALLNEKIDRITEKDFYEYLNEKPFNDEEERDAFKTVLLRCMFVKSEKQLISQMKHNSPVLDILYGKSKLKKWAWNETRKLFYGLRNKIGVSYFSEIFLHETCIYTKTLKKLLDRGIKCFMVYDCFYMEDKISEKEFYSILKESCDEYLKKYKELIEKRKNWFEEKNRNSKSYNPNYESYECELNEKQIGFELFKIQSEGKRKEAELEKEREERKRFFEIRRLEFNSRKFEIQHK